MGGRNLSPKVRIWNINQKEEIGTCTDCKYKEKYEYGHFKCSKNDFNLDYPSACVCDDFKESEILKRKRDCGFRYLKK